MSLKNIKVNKPIDLRSENNQVEESFSEKIVEQVEAQKKYKEYQFPDNFLWGTSTSAYQVEGGIKNDWSQWEKSDKRKKQIEKRGDELKDFVAGQACDSYHRYEEDFDSAVEIGTNSIRIGIEWARIEPKKDMWDVEAIKHYRKMLKSAKERGFVVVLTIWHWTNPIWITEQGGWSNKKTVKDYLSFVEIVAEELGLYVDYWVTLNEPMVHVVNGYLCGKFPPNKKNPVKALKTFNNLVKAHTGAYGIIHRHFEDARVSITGLINYTEPSNKWNLIEIGLAKIIHYSWNHRFLKKIKNHWDYIGLDYYFHDRIIWYPPFKKNENKVVNDMGWEIYPKGIYYVLKYLAKFNKPVIILENGIPDANDKKRADFIRNHLFYIHKAIQEGVDVKGYFYWSLLDNFEWLAGWSPKFGLVKINSETGNREIKESALVYKEICESNILKI
ncbi:glycoside hydrolase family 1 protein [Candidatus Parcubacteria bacterium]|nr:glycoside hydrolase family 1 protein [Candidatus Parcubacteria bacterium]